MGQGKDPLQRLMLSQPPALAQSTQRRKIAPHQQTASHQQQELFQPSMPSKKSRLAGCSSRAGGNQSSSVRSPPRTRSRSHDMPKVGASPAVASTKTNARAGARPKASSTVQSKVNPGVQLKAARQDDALGRSRRRRSAPPCARATVP